MVLLICGRERPDPAGQLLVGGAELVQQLLVGRGLLERVELLAVQVLQQRVAQHVVVGGLADDGRDRLQARLPTGPPAPLAHDELVALAAVVVGQLPHDDGLEQPDLADGHDQLGQRLLVEVGARLQRVGRDAVDRTSANRAPATGCAAPASGCGTAVSAGPLGMSAPGRGPASGATRDGHAGPSWSGLGLSGGGAALGDLAAGVEVGERPRGPGS
jgi:hypothetical protein